jgi:hypothetical protein
MMQGEAPGRVGQIRWLEMGGFHYAFRVAAAFTDEFGHPAGGGGGNTRRDGCGCGIIGHISLARPAAPDQSLLSRQKLTIQNATIGAAERFHEKRREMSSACRGG